MSKALDFIINRPCVALSYIPPSNVKGARSENARKPIGLRETDAKNKCSPSSRLPAVSKFQTGMQKDASTSISSSVSAPMKRDLLKLTKRKTEVMMRLKEMNRDEGPVSKNSMNEACYELKEIEKKIKMAKNPQPLSESSPTRDFDCIEPNQRRSKKKTSVSSTQDKKSTLYIDGVPQPRPKTLPAAARSAIGVAGQSSVWSEKSKSQIPSKRVKLSQQNPMLNRRNMNPKRGSGYYDDDDDGLDDFIVDDLNDSVANHWQKELRMVTKYDPRNYSIVEESKNEVVESSYCQQIQEEMYSTRIAGEEDAKELRRIRQEEMLSASQRKKRTLS